MAPHLEKELTPSQKAFYHVVEKQLDQWVPACGGTETAFTARSGARLIYLYNPVQGKHAYLNVDQDIILTDEEARMHLQTY